MTHQHRTDNIDVLPQAFSFHFHQHLPQRRTPHSNLQVYDLLFASKLQTWQWMPPEPVPSQSCRQAMASAVTSCGPAERSRPLSSLLKIASKRLVKSVGCPERAGEAELAA